MRSLEGDDVYRGSPSLSAFYTAPEKGSSAIYKAVNYSDQPYTPQTYSPIGLEPRASEKTPKAGPLGNKIWGKKRLRGLTLSPTLGD